MASAALSQLATLLDALQSRVAVLEKGAGVTPPAASAGAGGGAVDDEPVASTREFDALVAAYGDELASVGAALGGDVAKIVRARGGEEEEQGGEGAARHSVTRGANAPA